MARPTVQAKPKRKKRLLLLPLLQPRTPNRRATNLGSVRGCLRIRDHAAKQAVRVASALVLDTLELGAPPLLEPLLPAPPWLPSDRFEAALLSPPPVDGWARLSSLLSQVDLPPSPLAPS